MRAKILDGGSVTTSSLNTASQDCRTVETATLQFVISSVVTASQIDMKVQGSNDNTNWDDITNATAQLAAAGSASITIDDVGYRYLRGNIDVDAGTCVANVIIAGKDNRV